VEFQIETRHDLPRLTGQWSGVEQQSQEIGKDTKARRAGRILWPKNGRKIAQTGEQNETAKSPIANRQAVEGQREIMGDF